LKTVLVADDDQALSAILVRILENENFRVLHETDGPSALETARRQRPDLIILDLMMPYLDGLGVLMKLQGDDPPLEAPVIILTAQESEEFGDLAEALGAVKFIEKPFDVSEFVKAVHDAMEPGKKNDAERGGL